MDTDGEKSAKAVSRIVQSLDADLQEKFIQFFASGFDAMLQLYSEAFRKKGDSLGERQAQLSIAAARLAAFCEGASDFFATAATEHVGTDEHAIEAAKAAVSVVTCMVNRKIAQWAEESVKKVN